MSKQKDNIPSAAALRLSFYLRQLESLERAGVHTISSSRLGEALNFSDAQIRKDLAYFGQFGRPGVGYRVTALIEAIRKIVGIDRTWKTVLVGVGNLGRALLAYKGFCGRNFCIVAAFDSDSAKVGRRISGVKIHSMRSLPTLVKKKEATLAIIAVPAQSAQSVAEELAAAGIKGILNFAPATLYLPRDVQHLSVDLTIQLEQVAFKVTRARS